MRFKPRLLFSLMLMALAACAVFMARRWPLKAALFPFVTGIPLFLLAGAELALEFFRGDEESAGPAVELELTTDVDPAVARRRIVGILIWIAGFIVLVFLVGFPIAVPLFIFCYLKFQSRIGWGLSLGLTAAAWFCFYGLFQWLLNQPFEDGFIQSLLGL